MSSNFYNTIFGNPKTERKTPLVSKLNVEKEALQNTANMVFRNDPKNLYVKYGQTQSNVDRSKEFIKKYSVPTKEKFQRLLNALVWFTNFSSVGNASYKDAYLTAGKLYVDNPTFNQLLKAKEREFEQGNRLYQNAKLESVKAYSSMD